MTDYRDPAPIVFGPPRLASALDILTSRSLHCDHAGRKQTFNGYIWRCECGAKLSQ